MLDDVALVLGGRPSRNDGDDVAGSEGRVGVMNEVVLGVGIPLSATLASQSSMVFGREPAHLVDDLVPFLTANSDLDSLLHEAS